MGCRRYRSARSSRLSFLGHWYEHGLEHHHIDHLSDDGLCRTGFGFVIGRDYHA